MLQNTGGSFSSGSLYTSTSVNGADTMVVADFTGDGLLDVAVGSSTYSQIAVASGNGAGNLILNRIYALGSTGAGVVTADFNGDGRADLASGASNQAQIFLQHVSYPTASDSTFTATVTAPTSGNVSLVELTRSAWGGNVDFNYWAPTTAAALSITPPLTSTLTTGRTVKSGQLASWSVAQTIGTSTNVNWNNIYLSGIRESSSTKTGARIYTRQ
jgi:hypothetical protein